MEFDELKKKSAKLRSSLVELVLTTDEQLPDLDCLRIAISETARLDGETQELQVRLDALTEQKSELAEIESELSSANKTLSTNRKLLDSLHQPLGHAAFDAYERGRITEQPIFTERQASVERLAELAKECVETESETGVIAKTKAKARQALIWGKIRIEESQVRAQEKRIGRALIETHTEDSIACEETALILMTVSEARHKVQDADESVKHVAAILEGKITELYTKFGLGRIRNSQSLKREIERCKSVVERKREERDTLHTNLPDQILEEAIKSIIAPNSSFARLINRLREIEIRIQDLSSEMD